MQLSNLLAFVLAATAAAVPVSGTEQADASLDKRADARGSYTVSGLGSRKQAILNAGGNTLDLALAMLETERMSTDYAYGERIQYNSPLTQRLAINFLKTGAKMRQ